ncbi:cell division protein FtsQ/DivIB [Rhodoplanes sp. SY1]|uniref:cell division protein FtsQ/DivIB n=1 Tax=Rhodoplanes sp. SY1 TaxID=3166646 RepID=UPI0038B51EEA
MDGGGRVFEPLTGRTPGGSPRPRAGADTGAKPGPKTGLFGFRFGAKAGAKPRDKSSMNKAARRRRPAARRPEGRFASFGPLAAIERRIDQIVALAERWPRWGGAAATVAIILSSIGFGIVRGDHAPVVLGALADVRDMAANAVGFRITGVALTGHKHLSRDEVLAIAGITGRSSLLFLDAADARARLRANPWVAEATVQKLYPDRVAIDITERAAFALWQKDGQVHVIAADGTVLDAYVSRGVMALPFVVGTGADTRARAFLATLDRHPGLRDQVAAAVLVAERRWNLKLKNGIDVRLPETEVPRALDQLAALEQDKKLLSRDIVMIDLRLPDRVTVRLSDGAFQAREEAQKAKKPKPKGGAA